MSTTRSIFETKKAALLNLGCKVNQYETDAMQRLLEDAGCEIVPFTDVADIYVVNTCSVTHVADKKSRQMLSRARKLNPNACVVAAGCYVQTLHETGQDLPVGVDLVIGNNEKRMLVGEIARWFAGRETELFSPPHENGGTDSFSLTPESETADMQPVIDINAGKVAYENLHITRTAEHTRAFVKIQDGCDRFCSYCIIPFARGRSRSRAPEDILREVETLAKNGYREIVLTGIHISSYAYDDTALADIIELLANVDGILRIRLGSLEPTVVAEEFASRLSKIEKLCPHFHLSLQSGCDETLKRMNRHYTTDEYRAACGLLRSAFQNPAITTDIIVGFPGETDEEFTETVRFAEEIGFYEIHVFKYSVRSGTKAATMPNQISEQKKNERSRVLLDLTKRQADSFRKAKIGSSQKILLEEPQTIDGKEYLTGFTKDYVRVAVPAEGVSRNEIVTVTPQRIENGVLFTTGYLQ